MIPKAKFKFLSDYIIAVLTAFIVFTITPLGVLANNSGELGGIDRPLTLLVLAGAGLIAAALACIILTVIIATGFYRPVIRNVGLFIFVFLFVTGLLLPLTGPVGQVETLQIPTRWSHVFAAFFLASSVMFFRKTQIAKGVLRAIAFFAVASGLWSGISFFNSGSDKNAFDHLTLVSKDKNVFVLSFDGLSRGIVADILKTTPSLRDALKDFTFFDRAVSTPPSTVVSIVSETMGGLDLKAMYGTEANMLAKLDRSKSITSQLQENGYEVSIYGAYAFTFADDTKVVQQGSIIKTSVSENIDRLSKLVELSMARLFSPPLAFGREPGKTLAEWIEDATWGESRSTSSKLTVQTRSHTGADWDIPNVVSEGDYLAFLNKLEVGADRPTAHFLHFLHTHFPVDFDSKCVYRSDDARWFQAHQNRAGAEDQTRCAMTQLVQFLDKLKKLNIYSNSTIVLKSDHGEPVPYSDPGRYESFKVRGNDLWGYSRYTPMLLIKPAGRVGDQMTTDSRSAILSDLARTICVEATPQVNCSQFVGHDLLAKDLPSPDEHYTVNIVTDPKSTFQLDTHESISLPRRDSFFKSLTEFLTDEILKAPLTCGQSIDLAKGDLFNNGRTDSSSWVTWRNRNKTFLKWSRPDCDATTLVLSVKVDKANETSATTKIEVVTGSERETREIPAGQQTTPVQLEFPIAGKEPRELELIADNSDATVILFQLSVQ